MKKNTDFNLYIFIILAIFFILTYLFLDYFIELINSWNVIKNSKDEVKSTEKIIKKHSTKREKKVNIDEDKNEVYLISLKQSNNSAQSDTPYMCELMCRCITTFQL